MLEGVKNIKADRKELRKFGVTVAVVLGLLGGLLLYKGSGKYIGFWGVGFLFLISGLLLPEILKSIYKAWMTFALILGWFNTHLILGVIFFLVFTPMGLVMRLFGKDLLDQKFPEAQESYWKKREKSPLDKTRHERLS